MNICLNSGIGSYTALSLSVCLTVSLSVSLSLSLSLSLSVFNHQYTAPAEMAILKNLSSRIH